MEKPLSKPMSISAAEISDRVGLLYGSYILQELCSKLSDYLHVNPIGSFSKFIETWQTASDATDDLKNLVSSDFRLSVRTCFVPDVMLGAALDTINIGLSPERLAHETHETIPGFSFDYDPAKEAAQLMIGYLVVICRFGFPVDAEFAECVASLPFSPDDDDDGLSWTISSLWECSSVCRYWHEPLFLALAECLIARRLEGKRVNILQTPLFDEGLFPLLPIDTIRGEALAVDRYLAAFAADEATAMLFASDAAKEKWKSE